jgi:transcription antitermination factor NusG
MAAAKWYAIRTKPGTQRTVPGGRLISQIERTMEEEKFECYMPSYLYEVKHHRTKKWSIKRAPIFVGYAFIRLHPGQSLDKLREVDGVMCVLKPHKHLPAVEFKPADMDIIRSIEQDAEEMFKAHQWARIKWEEKMSRKVSRKDVKAAFPPNTKAVIADNAPFGGMLARVIGPSSKGKVKAVVEMLNGFTSIDIPIENLRQAG